MKPEELKVTFDKISSDFMSLSKELEILETNLELKVDRSALAEIISNCHWAAENTTVIGLHQIGEALDDNMGQ